jgi:hypothetical protein
VEHRPGGWAVRRTLITAVTSLHGWGALGGIAAIVAITYVITLLILTFRTDQRSDGINIWTPFFTFTKGPSNGFKKRRRPKRTRR